MFRDTLIKTALFSTGGVLVGTLHALSSKLGASSEPDVVTCTPVKYIPQSGALWHHLQSLHDDFVDVDVVAAVRTLNAIEKILEIEAGLRLRSREPTLEDRTKSCLHFRTAKDSVQRFLAKADETRPARDVVRMQRVSQRVMDALDTHMNNIVVLTRDIYLEP